MRLKWNALPIDRFIDEVRAQPDAVVFCAQSTLGPTRLVLLEIAQTEEAQHFDEIDGWLVAIEAKIQQIEAMRLGRPVEGETDGTARTRIDR